MASLEHLSAGGRIRSYLLSAPKGRGPFPLLVLLHGGNESAIQVWQQTSLPTLAARDRWILAAPDAVHGHWNDGRGAVAWGRPSREEDVGFLSALIGELIQKVGADPKAIFMAGVSNGGFMIQRFASLQGRTLAGAAVVAASLPAYLPKAPIGAVPKHWLFLHGVYDPIVPLEGSAGLRGIRLAPAGGFLSAEATFQFWADQSGCTPEVFSDRLPGADGSSVLCKARASQKGDALCLQYIFAGGHVWPGFPLGPLGERWLGPSCMAFDAGSLIWQFFQKVVAQHRPSV